jgi:hypothetical protein
MKKIVSVLFAVVCVGLVMPAQAQIQFGVKGGLSLTGAPSTSMDENLANVGSATGFFFGPMVDVNIPVVGLGVDGALMYAQKGNTFNGAYVTQRGLELPVNLKYSFGLGSLASVFATAGPSLFFNWNNGVKALASSDILNKDVSAIGDYKPLELSFNVGVGVKALRHLQIGVNYNIPVTNSAVIKGLGSNISESSFKTRTWQASVAYMF